MKARRVIGWIAFSVGIAATIAVTLLWTLGADKADQISSVMSVAIALVGLTVSILGLFLSGALAGAGAVPPVGAPAANTQPVPATAAPGHASTVGRDGTIIIGDHNRVVSGFRVRNYALVALVLVTAGAAGAWLNRPTRNTPTCDDIGVFESGYDRTAVNREPWLAAYHAAGGAATLGCPVERVVEGRVHGWGQGGSQDLVNKRNGREDPSRLMSADGNKVVVLRGVYYAAYGAAYFNKNDAATHLGYPVSDPISCGNSEIMPLNSGVNAPGVLIKTSVGEIVWLPKQVWKIYVEYGGPVGNLGLPMNGVDANITGEIRFHNGSSIELYDGRAIEKHANVLVEAPVKVEAPHRLTDFAALCRR